MMRQLKFFVLVSLICSGCKCGHTSGHVNASSSQKQVTQYGYNIIVAADLSNRIMNDRRYDDPAIVQTISGYLKTLFQKSIDVGTSGKFYLTTVNSDDFKQFDYKDFVFKIDLEKFGTNATARSNYLYHSDSTTNSLKHDLESLNNTFGNFYNRLRQSGNQLPADMWYFFQDNLTYPVVDTTSNTYVKNNLVVTNRYKSYIIILTDGYIEAGRYADNKEMISGNKVRFLSENTVEKVRQEYSLSGKSKFDQFFRDSHQGIIPVQNPLLNDCKVLVLEIYDRSEVNGVSTKTPKDSEIIKCFWKDWLVKSNVEESNLLIYPTMANKQNLDAILKDFFDLNKYTPLKD